MFRAEHFELDVENRGNQLIGWIGTVLNVVARYIPEYPPPIPLLQRKQKENGNETGQASRTALVVSPPGI